MTDTIPVVALVACSRRKLSRPALARDLYQGQLFKAARAYVEAKGWPQHILSARYRLVDVDEVLEPYDHVLGDDVVAWSADVWEALLKRYLQNKAICFCFLAGKRYYSCLVPLIQACPPWRVSVPLSGCGYAQQVARLKNVIKRFEQVCGEYLRDILAAERPEPAVIRAVEKISADLWAGKITGITPKDAWAYGLLLPALWLADPPMPADRFTSLPPEQIGNVWREFVGNH